jgi:homoaconitase/3-isopropylmalate dehydratase large subunit
VPAAVLELHGPAIDGLDLPARLALCAALAAAGRAANVPPDLPTRAWLAARRPVRREAGPAVHAGDAGVAGHAGDAGDGGCTGVAGSADGPAPGARESDDGLDVDAATAAPTALQGGFGGRRHALRSGEATPAVDEAWLGGRLEELREAAEVLRDHSVRRGLRLAVVAASQRTLLHAIEEGLAADMLRAGATLVPPGAAPPPLPAGILRVTNVPGRAHGSDEVLAGPAVVAASAVAGRLVEPETMRRAHRRATRVH